MPFRRRPQAWVLGAAAAVLAAFVIVVIGTRDSEPAESVVAQPSTPATSAVDDPDSAFLLSLVGSKNLGPLDDPSKLAGCLRANGIDEGRPLLGSGEIRIDGAPAIVLLFTGSQPRQITALTVGINCSDGNPNTLSVKNIG